MRESVVDDKILDYLTEDIKKSYEENKQPPCELASKMKVLRIIENYVKGPFSSQLTEMRLKVNAVLPFGSTTTNLGTPGGDLDIVISTTKIKGRKKSPNSILGPLYYNLKRNALQAPFKKMEHISSAKVPIIAGEFMGIELDISAQISDNPPPAYIAGQMINAYGEFDDRFDPLCAYVKKWMKQLSKSCGKKEERRVKKYLPSSSTSTLLVIHFLQYKGVIPNLYKTHNEFFNEARVTWGMVKHWEENEFHLPKKDIRRWIEEHQKDSKSTLGKLFIDFLIYYTETISLENDVLDLVNGRTVKKRDFEIDSDDWKGLFINNLNDKMNPGSQVEQVAQFVRILKIALKQLKTCGIPNQSVSRIMNMRLRFKKGQPVVMYGNVCILSL